MSKKALKRSRAVAASDSQPELHRAVIYCRVSSAEQTHNLSLPTQEKQAREYCRQQGWFVVRVFKDGGRRGGTADREAMKDLIAFCRQERNRIDYVVVLDLSRFARGNDVHRGLREELRALNVNLRAVTQNIDESPSGVLQEGIFATLSHWENAVRRDRVTLGMQARIELKGWPFQAALGYRKVRDPLVGPTLEQDPERAPLIREAFQLVSTGLYTPAEVLKKVTAKGLRTVRGKPLTSQSFSDLLRKPIYAGWLVVENWKLKEKGQFEPIIDEQTYQQVQRILAGKPTAGKPKHILNPLFPLRGFVRCKCSVPLTGAQAKGRSAYYAYYRCQYCDRVNIPKDTLEADFEKLLADLQARSDLLPLV